jgi:2-iminobutanoate/2-iminopropanoate deaminase
MRIQVATKKAPEAIGPYSQAISCGSMVYCSGQIPVDPQTGEIVSDDIADQTHQVMKNLSAVLNEAGVSFNEVVKCTIYLQDLKNFSKVNAVYATFFTPPYPARATIEVSSLPKGVGVEIEALAYRTEKDCL